jgi:hypothetical protein
MRVPGVGNPLTEGARRGFQGLRTGDQRSLYLGAALLMLGWWRRARARKLIYRRNLRQGEALLIRASRAGRPRIVVGDDLAVQAVGRARRER